MLITRVAPLRLVYVRAHFTRVTTPRFGLILRARCSTYFDIVLRLLPGFPGRVVCSAHFTLVCAQLPDTILLPRVALPHFIVPFGPGRVAGWFGLLHLTFGRHYPVTTRLFAVPVVTGLDCVHVELYVATLRCVTLRLRYSLR